MMFLNTFLLTQLLELSTFSRSGKSSMEQGGSDITDVN